MVESGMNEIKLNDYACQNKILVTEKSSQNSYHILDEFIKEPAFTFRIRIT